MLYSRCDMIDPDGAAVVELLDPSPGPGLVAFHSSKCPGADRDNEDAAGIITLDENRAVLIVADGVGGQPHGDVASALAVQTLIDAILESPEAADPAGDLRTALLNGIERANAAVIALGSGAGTTLLAVEINPAGVRTFHIGDSQAVHVSQRGTIRQATISHSPVGYAVESGILAEADAIEHEDRHIVSNLVGTAEMRIDLGSAIAIKPRDTLLLASDGVFDNLHMNEIVASIRTGPIEEAAGKLVSRCRKRMVNAPNGRPSKPDDLTVMLFRPRG